eukprot:1158156-Pelagomonas_calceolata.AAC.2
MRRCWRWRLRSRLGRTMQRPGVRLLVGITKSARRRAPRVIHENVRSSHEWAGREEGGCSGGAQMDKAMACGE